MWGNQEVIRNDVKVRTDVVVPADYERVVVEALWGIEMRISEAFHEFDFLGYERHLVARYGVGGHFEAHRDNLTPATRNRRLAVSINLNDDYGGGELFLPEAGVVTKAPPGAAVVFLCSTLHGVREVYEGARYAYLTFII